MKAWICNRLPSYVGLQLRLDTGVPLTERGAKSSRHREHLITNSIQPENPPSAPVQSGAPGSSSSSPFAAILQTAGDTNAQADTPVAIRQTSGKSSGTAAVSSPNKLREKQQQPSTAPKSAKITFPQSSADVQQIPPLPLSAIPSPELPKPQEPGGETEPQSIALNSVSLGPASGSDFGSGGLYPLDQSPLPLLPSEQALNDVASSTLSPAAVTVGISSSTSEDRVSALAAGLIPVTVLSAKIAVAGFATTTNANAPAVESPTVSLTAKPSTAESASNPNLATILNAHAAAAMAARLPDNHSLFDMSNKAAEAKGIDQQTPVVTVSAWPSLNLAASAVTSRTDITSSGTLAAKPSLVSASNHGKANLAVDSPTATTAPGSADTSANTANQGGQAGSFPPPSPGPVSSPLAGGASATSSLPAPGMATPTIQLVSPGGRTNLPDGGKTPSDSRSTEETLSTDSSAVPVPGLSAISGARMLDASSQSEMHIDLRSPAFGNVEVHTTVHESQIGLTVGSERGDLHTFLTAEVPGLQSAFRQQDMHFDQIRFLGQGGTAAGFSAGSDTQSGFQRQGRPPQWTGNHETVPPNSHDPEAAVSSAGGLNIHA